MRTRAKTWLLLGGLLSMIATPGCDPATAIALPALIITNTWDVEGQENRSFSFESSDDGEERGTFIGTESEDFVEIHTLTGSWADGELRFQTDGGAVYTGTFHDLPNRLVVASSFETLVLNRQNPDG